MSPMLRAAAVPAPHRQGRDHTGRRGVATGRQRPGRHQPRQPRSVCLCHVNFDSLPVILASQSDSMPSSLRKNDIYLPARFRSAASAAAHSFRSRSLQASSRTRSGERQLGCQPHRCWPSSGCFGAGGGDGGVGCGNLFPPPEVTVNMTGTEISRDIPGAVSQI